jgi:hypothetical protein
MTWLGSIKIYATISLLFGAAWAAVGYAHNKRRAKIKAEYRWHMSPVILGELEQPIRADAGELIL